ncbi:hypothetical protein CLAFUW4_08565 [Fulvia fulva]|uniref:Uncharacterized protein n=1 Tax=Passalora fulva TaxID=5499 RepID=A0A9Q8LC80_PASFU|nr:uncharacterized protein CLAFUR5_08667 [Fulvia fulva]KAK4628725.1 hypothetical protein CLAFUR4_08568 [Fulvia fulva]KAK4630607.1 hypothetical protein CLAFUR0_08563 [Fulvia fulva]UJO14711.1 hypothetical protein CLAFUR5_08667 [Fulvia fulva]WPV12401.1 hypothetical protein CLAFUW4_08565 [Fulvia fulva]WPV27414.1 hypothetical protein CLAFUW7_08563 [Fulvia fulva]
MPSAAPCGNLLCDASPGYTSQSNHSTTSPYEPSGPQAGSGDEGYFTPTALPQSSWSESAGTSAWPIQSFAIDFMNGPTSIVADMPAFGADANVDHRWVQQISTAANTPSMLMQSNGISLPCQCSMLLDDITALFRCQVSLPRTNFDQVLQVIHTAIQKGQTSLDCYGCATHGLQAVLTNVVVMLQQAAVCLQAILAIIDHDPCLATAGIKAEGYNLDTAELKMRMLHTMIDHELDGMQQLAHTVSTMAHMEHTHGKAYSGIMPLLTALQESLDVLRGRSMQPAQT